MSDKKEHLTFKENKLVFKRSVKMINQVAPHYLFRIIIGNGLSYIETFVGIYLSALIIDGIIGGKDLKSLVLSAVVCVGIEFVLNIFRHYAGFRHFNEYKGNFSFKVTKPIAQKVMTMDFTRVENADTHIAFEKARSACTDDNVGLPRVKDLIVNAFIGFALIIVGTIMISPVLFSKPTQTEGFVGFVQSYWGVVAVVAFIILISIFDNQVIRKKQMSFYGKLWGTGKVNQQKRLYDFYDNHVLFHYQNGKDIRIFNQQKLLSQEFDKCGNTLAEEYNRCFKGLIPYDIISYCVNSLPQIALYSFMIIRAATGMCSPGEVISTVLYFSELLTGIKYVSSSISEMPVSLKFCKYIFDFLDIPDEKYKGTIPTEKRDDNEYEFEFKHVYFKYPDSENYVLKDVNLKWRIGEKMALVGKNGCGKSTLVKLLCRLYDPTEGEITLNGIDIRKYKYEEYMALFSVVFQDSKLFSFSLAENVAADTEYDAERVENCVRRAGFSERLDTMENGIETCLYKDFDDKGVEISGGEMQKLCLARAIYKGSPFIVLDEPTAALDPISEHDIYTKFNGIVGTRTAIYISHRLSSCRFCDEITVMENGRIAERGSHDELLSKGGVYTELWTAQAEYYKDTAGELYA